MASPIPSATLRRLIDAVADLHSLDDSASFSERAIRTSNAIVQGEINVYTEIDPAAGRLELVADRGHSALAAVQDDFLRLQHQHPGIQRQVLAGEFGVHTISRLTTTREWKGLDIYHDVFAKMGLEDQIVVSAPMPAPMALGVTISRTRRGFKDSEIAALEIYEKHFTRAFQMEQRLGDERWLESSAVESNGGRGGFALASQDGAVELACPAAERLLATYFSTRVKGASRLPGPLLRRMKSLSSHGEDRLKASPMLRVSRGDTELRVDIRRQPRLDRWSFRFEEETADDRRRAKAESLSPRLKSVLDLLRRGRSEKEIADELGLARTTVHDYVKQIFRRIGVHSRAELMALWIRE